MAHSGASPKTGMVAVMRGLGLPLDNQVPEGTPVVTARLDATPAVPGPSYGDGRSHHGGPVRRD